MPLASLSCSDKPGPRFMHFGNRLLGIVVASWDAWSDCAEDFVGDRADELCEIMSRDRFVPLSSDEDDFISDACPRNRRDIDHNHVHAHQADNGRAVPVNKDRPSV